MTLTEINSGHTSFGNHLRYWRTTRGLTQLELAHSAASTSRHISFMETGRSRPGETMVLRLADALQVPTRDRNDLLVAAGYPAIFEEGKLDSKVLVPFQRAVHYTVSAHEPFPSFAINRWYDVLEKNKAAEAMFGSDRPEKKVNIIHAIFDDPEMKDRLDNWHIVAPAMAHRLRREASLAPKDARLKELLDLAWGALKDTSLPQIASKDDLVICPTFRVDDQLIRTISMVARFGSTNSVMLDELRVETIFPADAKAEAFFSALASGEVSSRPCWQS